MVKAVLLFGIIIISTFIGNLIASKYSDRVIELKNFKSALNMIKTKMKYTYQPIPEIFEDIVDKYEGGVKSIFLLAKNKMENQNASLAWETSFNNEACINLTKEDISVLKGMGKLLGKTDKDGQINEIEITENFLNIQIEKAEEERKKNEKMYKTLGILIGIAIAIILI